jgi:hypothetical protein
MAASKEIKELRLKFRLLRVDSVIEHSFSLVARCSTGNSPIDEKFVPRDLLTPSRTATREWSLQRVYRDGH